MPVTAQSIINKAIYEMSQVPGVSTQLYATPKLLQHLETSLQLEEEVMNWPALMKRFTVALDGTTGRITSDLTGTISNITDYSQIVKAWPANSNRQIMQLSSLRNPNTMLSGGRPRYMAADYLSTNRPVIFYPANATGNVDLWCKQSHPASLGLQSNVYLDPVLMLFDICWQYCTDDATIPSQVAKYEMLIMNRRKQLIGMYAQQPIPLDDRYNIDDMIQDDTFISYFSLDEHPLA